MKRFWQLPVAMFCLLGTLSSCCDVPTEHPTDNLSLSKTGVVMANVASGSDFTVTAAGSWSLRTDSNWIHPDHTGGGAGETRISFTVDANNALQRMGRVYVKAAGDDTEKILMVTQRGTTPLTGINKWIYDELSVNYLWKGAIAAAAHPDPSLPPESFLKALVENAWAAGAMDTSENPPTIDGSYEWENGQAVRTKNSGYSFIEELPLGTRAGSQKPLFGFDFEGFRASNGDPFKVIALVKWVQHNSPAEENGLKRGMWITKFNGGDMMASKTMPTSGTWIDFATLSTSPASGETLNIADGNGKVYNLTARTMVDNPILVDKVVSTPKGKKVAYLAYKAFETGDETVRGEGDFDRQLRKIFANKFKGVAWDLVLDLRYNHGGAVSSSCLLSSLVGNVDQTKIFAKLQFNNRTQEMAFQSEMGGMMLNKVYILVTKESASASELVINSLRGVGIEVVLIGRRTEGKNVGMTPSKTKGTLDGHKYEMWPITFKSSNAKGFCDYAGGFPTKPDMDEFREVDTKGGNEMIYDLGDPNERLLNAALTMIDGGSVPNDPATRAPGRERVEIPAYLVRPSGMFIYEHEMPK